MIEYLLCFLEADGHIGRTLRIPFESAETAIDYVAALNDEHVVELWDGNQMIRSLAPRIN
jgi:hypothetical protein